MTKNTVRDGETSEHEFVYICSVKYGYVVSKPQRTTDYDLVVDVNNKLYKVQVKSSKRGTGNCMVCKGSNGQGNRGKGKYPYPEESIDFFAIHDVIPNEWYLIPRKKTGEAKQIRLAYKSEGKYTKYKDNWVFNDY